MLRQALVFRDEWLGAGLSAEPSDREAAEAAVTGLYQLAGEPAPAFEWVASPAAAIGVARGAGDRFPLVRPRSDDLDGESSPVAMRLASLLYGLRDRLDSRDRRGARSPWLSSGVMAALTLAPLDALLSGADPGDVLEAAVLRSLRGTLGDAVAAPLRAALAEAAGDRGNVDGAVTGFAWYGQHDAWWVAHYDIRQRVGLGRYFPSDLSELGLWAELARSTGWWWPGQGLCVMAERPVAVHAEELPEGQHREMRLHREDGRAVEFADGTGICVLHGTAVPDWVIAGPTVELIKAEANIEVRRSAIERLGWDAYIDRAGLSLVAACPDPGNPGAVLSLYDDLADGRLRERVLVVVNGTPEPDGRRRRYGINVPAMLTDPVDAAGWTYGLTGSQYSQLARRT